MLPVRGRAGCGTAPLWVGLKGGTVFGRTAVDQNWPADRVITRLAAQSSASWTNGYLRQAMAADSICGLAAGLLAFQVRFNGVGDGVVPYLVLSLVLPVLWVVSVKLAGGYDSRFIGVGTDEF